MPASVSRPPFDDRSNSRSPSSSSSRRIAWLFFVVIVAKVIWEQTSWYNDMALADVIGGRVETRSHLLGTLAGMFFLLQIYWRRLLRLAPAD